MSGLGRWHPTRTQAIGLLVGVLALWLAVRGVSPAALGTALRGMDARWLVPVTLLFLVQQWARAVRQFLLVRVLGPTSFRSQLSTFWIGVFCINTFPARLGEAVRPLLWRQRDDLPVAAGVGLVVAERTLDVLGLLVSLLIVALLTETPAAGIEIAGRQVDLAAIIRQAVLALLPPVLVVLIGIAFFGGHLLRLLDAVRRWGDGSRWERVADAVGAMGVSVVRGVATVRAPRVLIAVSVLTALHFVCMGWSAACLAVAFGLETWIGPVEGLGVLCITMLGIALPAPPGFAGVFEASVRAGLALFGVRGEGLDAPALGFAVVIHAWLYLVHGLGTVYFVAADGVSIRETLARARSRKGDHGRSRSRRTDS